MSLEYAVVEKGLPKAVANRALQVRCGAEGAAHLLCAAAEPVRQELLLQLQRPSIVAHCCSSITLLGAIGRPALLSRACSSAATRPHATPAVPAAQNWDDQDIPELLEWMEEHLQVG